MKTIIGALVLLSLFFGLAGNTYATECHQIKGSSDWPGSDMFSPPYNVFSSGNELLLKANCNGNQVTLSVGDSRNTTNVHSQAYYTVGEQWVPIQWMELELMKNG